MDSELDVVSRPQVPIHLQRHAGSSLFTQTNPQGPHLCSEGKQGDRWTFAGHPRCAQVGGPRRRHPGEVPWKGPCSERQVWTWVMVLAWSWARLCAVHGEIATGECRAACGTGDGLEVTCKQSQMGPGPQSRGRSALKAQGCSRERVCSAWGWQEAAYHLEG